MSTTVSSVPTLSRREFLYYVWAASMALFLAEGGGAVLWFTVPRFKLGEFGGVFKLDLDKLPPPDGGPAAFDAGRFWLVNVGPTTEADPRHPAGQTTRPGVLAIYKVCVHLGCIYDWKATNNRFECPCHGSKYLKDGTRVRGPASRNLDRFVVRALDAEGNVLDETVRGDANQNPAAGAPLDLPPGTTTLQIDTGLRVKGRNNGGPPTVE
jgi:cytochrome b6-f complex iron-sulfur subunit